MASARASAAIFHMFLAMLALRYLATYFRTEGSEVIAAKSAPKPRVLAIAGSRDAADMAFNRATRFWYHEKSGAHVSVQDIGPTT